MRRIYSVHGAYPWLNFTEPDYDGITKDKAQDRMVIAPNWFAQVRAMRLIFVAFLLATAGGAEAARIVFAGGNWAAIDFGARCEARSKALWPKPKSKPFAGFAFDRTGGLKGKFYVHLSRPARSGATVIATIGSEPFLLAGNGEWAWSRNPQQQGAILNAARYGTGMRVEARDRSGGRMVDRYALGGAATAIDAAAAACAGKIARR